MTLEEKLIEAIDTIATELGKTIMKITDLEVKLAKIEKELQLNNEILKKNQEQLSLAFKELHRLTWEIIELEENKKV